MVLERLLPLGWQMAIHASYTPKNPQTWAEFCQQLSDSFHLRHHATPVRPIEDAVWDKYYARTLELMEKAHTRVHDHQQKISVLELELDVLLDDRARLPNIAMPVNENRTALTLYAGNDARRRKFQRQIEARLRSQGSTVGLMTRFLNNLMAKQNRPPWDERPDLYANTARSMQFLLEQVNNTYRGRYGG